MHTSFILAATEASDKLSHSFVDALPHLAGMVMVLCTLTILWGVCVATGKLVAIFAPAPAAVAPKPIAKAATAAPAPVATGTPPEIIAVIAAAVATVTGKSSRIIEIRKIDTSWEKAGRQSVLSSHRIR